MNQVIDKSEEWIKYVEKNASLLLNLTPDLPNKYEKLQELDNVTFLHKFKKTYFQKPIRLSSLQFLKFSDTKTYERTGKSKEECGDSFRHN